MSKLLSLFLGFIFKKTVPKFLLFFALYFLVAEFTPVILKMMGGAEFFSTVSGIFSSLPEGVSYFLGLFRVELGFYLVFSAYVTRFIIRRIPLMG
ncbi:hypothetical protein A1D23_03015 [Chelonobacter oris]|uniref:DUF2523 family protein n=1 Tax=Chelonobacter oris TaxID=505317 RepID=UPI00244B1C2F|nr:DUF2523 family protein [Chelonobacter oris]MDH3001579.1 hypothetical protein [Chelonobacter oris]